MTNPIPGADIERAACEASFMRSRRMAAPPARASDPAKIEDGADYEGTAVECYWQGWQARAAAKVGANVAADRERSPYVLGVKPSNWAEQIAAGAPAETPQRVDSNLFFDALSDFKDSPQDASDGQRFFERIVSAPAETPKPGVLQEFIAAADKAGVTALPKLAEIYGAAHPAPIAGDVEKDAAMREAVRDAVAENLRGLYYCGRVWSAWSVGTMGEDDFAPAEEDEDIISNITDAAIAAMLANSSSGEAG